jgi:methylphosphotriester-DNA--protein-cysteine methyltransferase
MKNVSDDRIVEFGTHREAVDSGLRPCKTCRA